MPPGSLHKCTLHGCSGTAYRNGADEEASRRKVEVLGGRVLL